MTSARLAAALALVLLAAPPGRAAEPLFERDVLPILTKQCLGCHGGLKQNGKLDMRTIPSLLRGGKSGPAVKSGSPGASLLWQRVVSDEMPPNGNKLSAAEKATLKGWIAAGMPTLVQRQKGAKPLLSADRKHEPREVAAAIDKHLGAALEARKMKPAARSDDAEFLRRAYLDLTGRVPTAEQAAAFLDSQAGDRRARLIDALLATPEFGEQLGRTWRDWICPPELPSDGNGGRQPHREAQDLGRWLGERLAAGDSWDRIVRQVLTVEGDIKDQPQVIFFGLVGQGGRITPDGTARAVGSLFMGVQLQCAQCHDDPFRDWAQKEHWGLAAFFSRTNGDFRRVNEGAVTGGRGKKGKGAPAVKVVEGVKGEVQIVIPSSAFKNAGTRVAAAFPRGEAARLKGTALRHEFVDWLVRKDNPYFARAFANRLWFYFFAHGIVHPVDDFRELNPPSHPGLMKVLANEFAASGFDVKHLVRCICNSEAYQRTSRVAPGSSDGDTRALTAAFGRMPLRVMTADQLLDSLSLAYGDPNLDLRAIDPKDGNASGESAPVGDVYLEFLRKFGTNKEDATDFTHGIPQMLTLLNHPRLLEGSYALDEFRGVRSAPRPKAREKGKKGRPKTAGKPTPKPRAVPTPEETIDWLYLTTLSRRPTAEERKDALEYVRKKAAPEKAYLAVLWMLVNRSEYLFVR